MRILDYDELPSHMEGDVQLLDNTAGWGIMDFRKVKEARRLGYPAAEYFGVYAVEGGRVESMIRVLRLPFTTLRGTERVAAIQGVVTRLDRSRMGLARSLMKEVLERERRNGSSYALLWTSRGNVAHALYSSLGYVDVHTPDIAVRRCVGSVGGATRLKLRKARAADWPTIERLHREATRGRTGFAPRWDGIVRSLLKLGFLEPGPFMLVVKGSAPVGYGFLRKDPGWPVLDELVVLPGVSFDEVIPLFEWRARGRWLTLRNTLVRDSMGTLKRRGYSFTDQAYYTLMAAPLGGSRGDVPKTLGVSDPSFTCQRLDYF